MSASPSATSSRFTCRLCSKSWSAKSGKSCTLIPKDSPIASNIESIIPTINSMFSSRFGRRYSLPEEACKLCCSKVNKIIEETVSMNAASSPRSQRIRRPPRRLEDIVESKPKKRRVSSTPRKLTELPDSRPVILRTNKKQQKGMKNVDRVTQSDQHDRVSNTVSQQQDLSIEIPAYSTEQALEPVVHTVFDSHPIESDQLQVQVKTRKNISLLTNKEVLTVESVTMDGMEKKVIHTDGVHEKVYSPECVVTLQNKNEDNVSADTQNLNVVGVSIQDILKAVDTDAVNIKTISHMNRTAEAHLQESVRSTNILPNSSQVVTESDSQVNKRRKGTVKKISDKVWKTELLPEVDLSTKTKPEKDTHVKQSEETVYEVTVYDEGENVISLVTDDLAEKSRNDIDQSFISTSEGAANCSHLFESGQQGISETVSEEQLETVSEEQLESVEAEQLETLTEEQHANERHEAETIALVDGQDGSENMVEQQCDASVEEQQATVVTEQHEAETIIDGQDNSVAEQSEEGGVHEESIKLSEIIGEISEPVIVTVEVENETTRFMVIGPDGRTWESNTLPEAQQIIDEYHKSLESKNDTDNTKCKDEAAKVVCKVEVPEKSPDEPDAIKTVEQLTENDVPETVACKVDIETSQAIESINTNKQEEYIRAKQERIDGRNVENDTIIVESRPIELGNTDSNVPITQTSKICVKIHRKELKELICPICDVQFVFRPELINHVLSDHPDKVVLCKTCNQVFKTKEEMVEHVKSSHPKKACQVEGCMFIGKPHDVMRHGSVHTKEKNFQCGNCAKYFKSQNSLHNHIRIIHENSQVQKCLVCGKSFSRTASYHEHMASAHTKDKQYKCKVCSQGFVSKHSWKRHENEYHCSPKYQCSLCDKLFLHKGDVSKHEKTHDKDTYKNVPCPVEDCNYKGYTKLLVWRHVTTSHMNIVKPRTNNINSSRRKFCSKCMQYVLFYDQHIQACEGLSEAELKDREEKSVHYAEKLDGIVKQVKERTGVTVCEEEEMGLTMPGALDMEEWSQLVKERVQLVQTGGFISFDVPVMEDQYVQDPNQAAGAQADPIATNEVHVQEDGTVIIDGHVQVEENENSDWTQSNIDNVTNTEYVLVENDSGETMLVEKSCGQNVVVMEVNNEEKGTNDKEALEAAQVLCAMQP
ncbi:unnamed protein product [Owenia fusiformis]|uniref:Uncharacterized protein n=1 Tax=Owenia fusiformis TaxID=6347 RepID=A0A8J1UA84_OWEFU|nr:unnamed protein product [Owenia fusiformis]